MMYSKLFFAISVLFVFCACENKKDSKPILPATQSNPIKEGDLNSLTLTRKAVDRLGIKVFKVTDESVGNSRIFSGEVIPIPGKTVTITAPVAGTLLPPGSGVEFAVGAKVLKGTVLGRILILPSERDLLSVQADIRQREIQYTTAQEKVKRNTLLYAEQAGSLRSKQEAEAELAAVAAQLTVARNRAQLLKGNVSQSLADRMSSLTLEAPITGVIQKVYTSTSQVLATAAPIVDVVSLEKLWIRVPVYAGDGQKINLAEKALVRGLSETGSSNQAVVAHPVTGPQTSDPLASSIDLYYEIDNSASTFRPGQKISITVGFTGAQSSLVVPYSAILYDIQGGTWVYEQTDSLSFSRRRVEVGRVVNGMAILNRGPANGTKVVTEGAAELFGTEFGGGK